MRGSLFHSRRCLALLPLLLAAAPAAIPHAHTASPHEAEICAGHLSHGGTSEIDHGGSCLRCRTSRGSEFEGTVPATNAPPLALASRRQTPASRSAKARSETHGNASPRGPPALS